MTLLWQASFLEPMVEVSSPIDPKHVSDVVQNFVSLDLATRRDVANTFLQRWSDVAAIMKLVRDAILGDEEGEEQKPDEERDDEEVLIEIRVFLKALISE